MGISPRSADRLCRPRRIIFSFSPAQGAAACPGRAAGPRRSTKPSCAISLAAHSCSPTPCCWAEGEGRPEARGYRSGYGRNLGLDLFKPWRNVVQQTFAGFRRGYGSGRQQPDEHGAESRHEQKRRGNQNGRVELYDTCPARSSGQRG